MRHVPQRRGPPALRTRRTCAVRYDMKKNVGNIDMLLRLLLAAALFYLGFADNAVVSAGGAKLAIGLFGFVPLLTGLLRYCPLYAVIGMSTCPRQPD